MIHSPLRWETASAALSLSERAVHVWRSPLDVAEEELRELQSVLSSDETRRAERFYRTIHRNRFAAARGTLRLILARYLDVDPAEIRFDHGAHGKPALTLHANPRDVRFNLSHSRDTLLLAIALQRELGVDVERIDEGTRCEQLAARFFSARENEMLGRLSGHARREGFFRCWTRKEAYIKGRGEGLSHPLRDFDVSLAPDARAEFLGSRRDAGEIDRWSLHDLPPIPGYAAALAAEGEIDKLCCWRSRLLSLSETATGSLPAV